MITATQIKYIQSLRKKKFRDLHGVFLAEGDKIVREVLDSSLQVEMICGEQPWMEQMAGRIPPEVDCLTVSPGELRRISTMKSPHHVVAVIKKPVFEFPETFGADELVLILDTLQDPGNLGTILRTADWFGVRYVFCSHDTADIYNPKVIQASMGSFIRISVHYQALTPLVGKLNDMLHVYGAFVDGQDALSSSPALPAALVIGNESQGISPALEAMISVKLSIPPYRNKIPGNGNQQTNTAQSAESLNAAVASAILMAVFRRRQP